MEQSGTPPPVRGFTPPPSRRRPPVIPSSRPLPRPANVMFARKSSVDKQHAALLPPREDSFKDHNLDIPAPARNTKPANPSAGGRLDDIMRNLELMVDDGLSDFNEPAITASDIDKSLPAAPVASTAQQSLLAVSGKYALPAKLQSTDNSAPKVVSKSFGDEERLLNARVQSLSSELHKCKLNWQADKSNWSGQLENAKSDVAKLGIRVTDLERELASANDSNESDKKELRDKLRQALEDQTSLRQQIDQLNQSLNGSKEENDSIKRQLEATKAELEQQYRAGAVTSQQFFELETRLEQSLQTIQQLERQLKDKDDSLLTARIEESHLRSGLDAAEKQCQQLLADIKQSEQRLLVETVDRKSQQQRIQILEAENGSLEDRLLSATERFNAMQQEFDVLQMREMQSVALSPVVSELFTKTDDEMEAIKNDNKQLKYELESARQELAIQTARMERIQQSINEQDSSSKYREQVCRLTEEFICAEKESKATHQRREQELCQRIQELEGKILNQQSNPSAETQADHQHLARENARLRLDMEQLQQILADERQAADKSIDEWEEWAKGIQKEAELQIKERDESCAKLETELHQVRKRFGKIIQEQEDSIQNLLMQQNHIIERMANGAEPSSI